MTPEKACRTCYVCKKLFCCEQCCERHEEKKHRKRKPNCPLCSNQKLPLKSLEDKTLLYHIVITHLPLYCNLCGEIFKQIKDLESFGTCKWWKQRHRHSLVSSSERKSALGTPPLIVEGQESSEGSSNYVSLISPPELYRTTSTPMILGQKASLNFKTPNAPDFSLKTPNTNSASLMKEPGQSVSQATNSKCNNSESNYMSLPSSMNHEETPFRSLPTNRAIKEEFPRQNTKKFESMKEENNNNNSPNEYCTENNRVEDMELTNVENEALRSAQSVEVLQGERRSESLKKVRFSDQYENPVESNSMAANNMTEHEEYFEACDSVSKIKHTLETSQSKIQEDNAKNMEKENRDTDKVNMNGNSSQQPAGTSRVVMMVVMENNSNVSTSDLIDSGLKKLERLASSSSVSVNNLNSASGSSSTSLDSYYSVSNYNYPLSPIELNSPASRGSRSSSNSSNDSDNSGGFFSVVANAVKTVMRNFSGGVAPGNVENANYVPRPSTSDTFNSVSNFASSLLLRPGKRRRDVAEGGSPPSRQTEASAPQIELRSPLAKRPRGWYRIKGREPIARMRNNRQIISPRGISSETQVFSQGSLSVGDTVLPLPDRAHQSTQTD